MREQRELARAQRLAPRGPTVASSAFVLVVACRRALTGSAPYRRRLASQLLALMRPDYAGYLEPQPGEQRGPGGARLLVHLMADLGRAVDRAERLGFGTPAQRQAVELFLGRGIDPLGADDAMRLAGPPDGRDDFGEAATKRRRRHLDAAFGEVFHPHTLPPRRASNARVRDHVAEAGFDALMRWLRRPPTTAVTARWIAAWDRNLPPHGGRTIALLSLLQLAAGRFPDADPASPSPVAHWYEAHKAAPGLRPRSRCSVCPATPDDERHCLCRRRAAAVVRLKTGDNVHSRDAVARGQAAVEVATWSLLHTHPRDWRSQAQIAWVVSREDGRPARGERDLGPDTLGAFGALLGAREPAPAELYRAAEQLDAMAGSDVLAVTAQLALEIVARPAAAGSELRPAVAALARSAAGALRELRSPQLVELMWRLDDARSGMRYQPKALEAWQDVQLAQQRRGDWHAAALAYELALAQIRQLEPDRQKRWEIEEQLHLGRVGGLLLEAEALLYAPGRRFRASADYARRLLKRAAWLADRDRGALWNALRTIPEVAARGAAHPDEQPPGVLRFTARWDVMPRIMLARVHVALAASHVPGARAAARRALSAARALIEQTRTSPLITPRQRWELARVELVAAIVEGDGDAIAGLAAVVMRSGDDGGDYVAPAARWRAGTRVSGPLRAQLEELGRRLPEVGAAAPRLPDLNALALAS